MRVTVSLIMLSIVMSSCVSKKKFAEVENKYQETKAMLDNATMKLNICLDEKKALTKSYEEQLKTLQRTNEALISTQGDLTTLTQKGAENLEKTLESMKEKDLQIKTMRDAINRKDSVTLALVTSLKSAVGNMDDEDIQINVEKGVVFVSISDKLLFGSGQYQLTDRAKEVLGKVAKVIKAKPDFEFMVEGHTDNVPISKPCFEDNWDLSTKRATSVVRVLQNEYNVDPSRMVAAGRGEYVPLESNSDKLGRARNRRTKIIVLPKLDQFYNMIEQGMKKL
ncbi:OmpA family protein [Flavobacterium sp. CS20]|jgi:chemotaxis protein MotB|uniref:OmpA/MotB family protein n=1 Tax=Flavobacterium sp. CS20 TaxID=2775246 RepID=UPI001B39DE2B|nr:OmpA family protein [Flavobacterium sp. CS20]QTY27018.1 OmpA family protein [Flavobacterium sp. CS20]